MYDKVGNRIYEIRTSKGFTQDYVSKKLNITQSAFSHMETGRRDITVSTLYDIADILNVTIHDLLPIDEIKLTTREIIELNEYKKYLLYKRK